MRDTRTAARYLRAAVLRSAQCCGFRIGLMGARVLGALRLGSLAREGDESGRQMQLLRRSDFVNADRAILIGEISLPIVRMEPS